jgi:hypothetical protein
MRRLKPAGILLAIGFCLAAGFVRIPWAFPSSAQNSTPPPTVEQIIANYNRALGGEETYHKFKTRIMKAVIHTVGSAEAGSLELYQAAPDKGMSSTYFPGDPPVLRGFDGEKGWVVTADDGPQDVTGDGLDRLKRDFDFYRDLNLLKLFPQMTFAGTEVMDGRSVFVTEAGLKSGGAEKFYFDSQSGLLVRRDTPAPESGGIRQTIYSDFRSVDGIQYPFKVHITHSEFELIIEYTEIRHDVPIVASKFSKPSA